MKELNTYELENSTGGYYYYSTALESGHQANYGANTNVYSRAHIRSWEESRERQEQGFTPVGGSRPMWSI